MRDGDFGASIRACRPLDGCDLADADRWDRREYLRRYKWAERRRRETGHDVSLRECPERVETTSKLAEDWVTPCRRCGGRGMNWDLRESPTHPMGMERFCLPCRRRADLESYRRNRAQTRSEETAARRKEKQRARLRRIRIPRKGAVSSLPCEFEGCDGVRRSRLCAGHERQRERAGGDLSKLKPLRRWGVER